MAIFRRTLIRLQAIQPFFVPKCPTILPSEIPHEEEKGPYYKPAVYYPANPGELLGGKYRAISKLGWGTKSTVWLAQDTKRSLQPACNTVHFDACTDGDGNPIATWH